jgi:hypothetical protein
MQNSNNAYKLLVEEPVYCVKYLVEEKNRNEPSNFYIQGPYLMASESNRNRRIYQLDEMVKEVDRYAKDMISTGRATGELEHPQTPNINLERVCHMVTHLKQNGNIFEGKSKVLNTPTGQLVKTLIQDGVKLGVSSRALGKLVPQGDNNLVQDFKLVAIDVVADPSVPSAFVNGILESKEWILNESGDYSEVLYTKFERGISKLPSKERDAYLRDQVVKFINGLKRL